MGPGSPGRRPTAYLFRTAMNVFRKRYRRAKLALRRTLWVVPRDDFVERIEARTSSSAPSRSSRRINERR